MSCRSRWSGPKSDAFDRIGPPQSDVELEALLRASIDRKDKKWSIGFPVVGGALCGGGRPNAGITAAAASVAVPSPPPPPSIPSKPGDVLSPSQVNGFLNCSAAWHYKYVRGLPSPSTGKQVRGRAVHALAAFWFRSRMAGLTPDSDVLAEAYTEIWDVESADAIFGPKESPAELFSSGAQLASMYIREVGDEITPAATEVAVEGTIGGVKVRGRIDLLCQDQSGKIIDLKTTSRKPSTVNHANAFQLATYAYLTPSANGLVQIDSLVSTKTPQMVKQSYRVSDADLRMCEVFYPNVQDAMQRGVKYANRNSQFCSRAYCPYVDVCVEENGGEVS